MNGAALAAQFSSATDDWATPQDFFDELDREWGFILDVCASPENAKCPLYFTVKDDCLKRDWYAVAKAAGYPGRKRAWMNPKYGDPEFPCKAKCKKKKCVRRGHHISEYVPGIIDFVRKAYEESQKGLTVVCLLPARTDTRWWHDYVIAGGAEVRFVRGRLKFGGAKNSAPFPSAVVVFRPPEPAPHGCPIGFPCSICG